MLSNCRGFACEVLRVPPPSVSPPLPLQKTQDLRKNSGRNKPRAPIVWAACPATTSGGRRRTNACQRQNTQDGMQKTCVHNITFCVPGTTVGLEEAFIPNKVWTRKYKKLPSYVQLHPSIITSAVGAWNVPPNGSKPPSWRGC